MGGNGRVGMGIMTFDVYFYPENTWQNVRSIVVRQLDQLAGFLMVQLLEINGTLVY